LAGLGGRRSGGEDSGGSIYGFLCSDDKAEASIAKGEGGCSRPKPLTPCGKFLISGPSEEGKTASIEEETENDQRKPTNHKGLE
jgi:hypothetical protein